MKGKAHWELRWTPEGYYHSVLVSDGSNKQILFDPRKDQPETWKAVSAAYNFPPGQEFLDGLSQQEKAKFDRSEALEEGMPKIDRKTQETALKLIKQDQIPSYDEYEKWESTQDVYQGPDPPDGKGWYRDSSKAPPGFWDGYHVWEKSGKPGGREALARKKQIETSPSPSAPNYGGKKKNKFRRKK
jgi:hypothetical protein